MKTIKALLSIFLAVSVSSAYCASVQPSPVNASSANTQATATLSAECTITAQDVKLGALVLPLSAQSASSSMTVLCSKSAPYTIALAYGGVYGKGETTGSPLVGSLNNGANNTCIYNINGSNQSFQIPVSQSLNCPSSYGSTEPYGYGMMMGVMSGDSIAYSIQVPNSLGEIWNTGEGSYSANGTGSVQSIPVVLTLVPAQSSGNYPSPDTYMDTVTATISY